MYIVFSIFLGFLFDLCLGDPYWMPHPVVFIGKGISFMEKCLRRVFPKTNKGEFIGGILLSIAIPLISFIVSSTILYLSYKVSFWLWFIVHTFWSYQILATRCLEKESSKVYKALVSQDLPLARKQLSYLVGRETKDLNNEEVVKACVETVAENTSDGVAAPLLYLFIGGVPLGFLYKAVNTLDSMVGYRNEKYEYFGKASAKLDDILNWIPARICGFMMAFSTLFLHLNIKNAFKVFYRDRKKHLSPNSAQTESAVAGALGIQLGGIHIYFGEVVEKPIIGDELHKAEPIDIIKTNYMMIITSFLLLFLFGAIEIFIKTII